MNQFPHINQYPIRPCNGRSVFIGVADGNTVRSDRQSIRLASYDYSRPGAYFVTICVQEKECLFGSIVDDKMKLNGAGRMIESVWRGLPGRFPDVELDQFIIMPNHFHSVVVLNCKGESHIRPPEGNLGLNRVIMAFKSITTNKYIKGVGKHGWQRFPDKLWQRNYHERIIRDDAAMDLAREYIVNNPLKWALDRENPDFAASSKTTRRNPNVLP